MFALDLFNTDYERRLMEGGVDTLEQRRIDDLAAKMDELAARAQEPAYKKNPAALAGLKQQFAKLKAERDSYYRVREAGIPGNVPTEKIPGKEDLLKGKGRSYYEDQKKNSEATPLDQKLQRLKVQARRQFPRAQTDDEALVLKLLDKETRDDRLNRQVDARQDAELRKNFALDREQEDEIEDLQTQVSVKEHGGGIGPKQRWQDLMPEQMNPNDDWYDDDEDQETELRSGDYVRDTMDGESGEIFRMQGDPYERRVRILDRDGKGWYIEPGRLTRVDPQDPDVQRYFGKPRRRDMDEVADEQINELDVNTLKSYADKRGAQVAAMKADNPNPTAGSKEWIQQAVPAQQVNLAKRKIARKERQQGMAEGKADYNFDAEDLKRLERIRDLSTLKTQALALISRPSAKPMKPEKVEWFKNALDRMNSPIKVIKLMYDLLLSGEGHAVVGSRSSMNPNSYRQRFGEQGVAEGWSDAMVARRTGGPRTPYAVYIKGKKWKDFENEELAQVVANKLRAKFKADGRDPETVTIAPTDYDQPIKEEQDTSGVERAILNRIMVAHTDLLMKFGPDKVMQAAEEVAYNVGDVDEIGTSDVSAYVAQVKQILGAVDETQVNEKWSAKYKSSINCAAPKGFSQKAHCAGRKK